MASKRYRIVCIDDDRDTCDMMELWLKFAPFDYDVEAVDTAAEALELVDRHDADLYILDSSVTRDVDHLTILKTIRETDKTTPILIFSGMVTRIDRDEAFHAGANEYLTKPAESEDFVAAVERLLLQR